MKIYTWIVYICICIFLFLFLLEIETTMQKTHTKTHVYRWLGGGCGGSAAHVEHIVSLQNVTGWIKHVTLNKVTFSHQNCYVI